MPELSREDLHRFWSELVEKNCSAAGLRSPLLPGYLIGMLEDFGRTDRLYRLQRRGQVLSRMTDMLAFSARWSALPAQERALRQYLGDFSLFMTGLFPESLEAADGAAALALYISTGKSCYRAVSAWGKTVESGSWEERAVSAQPAVFALLADEFERCMDGLNLVRSELESLQDPLYRDLEQRVRHLIDDPL